MKRKQSVDLHDGEVVTKQNERRDVDDILRPVPQMGQQLGRTGREQPDEVADDHVPTPAAHVNTTDHSSKDDYSPPWQVEAALVQGNSRLVHDDANEERSRQQREGVEQLVHLVPIVSVSPMRSWRNGRLPSCRRRKGAMSRCVAP